MSNKPVPSVIMVLFEQSQNFRQTHSPFDWDISGVGNVGIDDSESGDGGGNSVSKTFFSVIVSSLFVSVVGFGNMVYLPV